MNAIKTLAVVTIMIISSIVFISSTPAEVQINETGVTLYVDDDYNSSTPGWGFTHFDLIQNATQFSSEDDKIYVYSGTYNENLIINKSITLVGENRTTTIIDFSGVGPAVVINSDDVIISNFTIKNSNSFALEINSSQNCLIEKNIIIDNLYGLNLNFSSYNNITGNIIKFKKTTSMPRFHFKYGIRVFSSFSNDIIGNYIKSYFDGISISDSDNNKISENNFRDIWNYAINLLDSDENKIISNNLKFTFKPLFMSNSKNNMILQNIIINNDCGIYIESNSNNNFISGNNISKNYDNAISISSSNYNVFSNNNIFCNKYGVVMNDCLQNNFTDNTMIENGIEIYGEQVKYWNNHNINKSNSVNGKPVYYWKNKVGGKIPSGAGQIILANCEDVCIENQEITYTSSIAIQISFSSDYVISNNYIFRNQIGIKLYFSSNIDIYSNNSIASNDVGVLLFASDNNNIIKNDFLKNHKAIYLKLSSKSNTINGNNISSSLDGIMIEDSSDDNKIYLNNFYINLRDATDNCNNSWNSSFGKGNYWDAFDNESEGAYDNDSNGIVDTPYNISGGHNQDLFPLMNISSDFVPPVLPDKTSLKLFIESGFQLLNKRISLSVANNGSVKAYNVHLSLSVEYGFLSHNKNNSGEFNRLEPKDVSDSITIDGLCGLGKIKITAEATADNADSVQTTASGWIIGRFIILTKL